ncbi:hypothetical protein TDB9533_03952 [Thalassocella blandensis]|nr:hypothetical protein TDB9533_03952 [Thalassocella blandensis]
MYLDFFGLTKSPFRITPDTQLFYQGCDRGAVLQTLCYAIEQGEGILKVVGEVGTGKTMLCRMLPITMKEQVDWVYLAHPNLSPEQTLQAIAYELGITLDANTEKFEVMRILQNALLERYNRGRKVVVLVEEAQGMPLETLEEIRLLSNLETEQHKLMQIVLFGQPELDDNLSQVHIRQLRERITHSVNLSPFTPDVIHEYLNFRMRAAGYKGPDVFSKKIAKLVCRYSSGLIRRVNILADKMLIIAFTQQRHEISASDVRDAALDSEFYKKKSWWPLVASFSIITGLHLLVMAGLTMSPVFYHVLQSSIA